MMKKILTLALCIGAMTTTYAQIEKGSTLIGGSVNFSSAKMTDTSYNNSIYKTKANNGGAFIRLGKSFKENSISGIRLGYSRSKYEILQNILNPVPIVDEKNNSFHAGVFHRVYKPLGHQFYIFGELGADYSYGKSKGLSGTRTTTYNGGNINIAPGISYKILKCAQLELFLPNLGSIGYTKSKSNFGRESSNFSFSSSLERNPLESLSVGFSFIL